MRLSDFLAIVKFLGSGYDMSSVLVMLTVLDTILGVAWRIKKNKSLFSREFNGGLITNILACMIPAMLQIISNVRHNPSTLYSFSETAITIGIFLALAQSIFANAQLSGFNPPSWLESFYHKFIDDEIHAKETRADNVTNNNNNKHF